MLRTFKGNAEGASPTWFDRQVRLVGKLCLACLGVFVFTMEAHASSICVDITATVASVNDFGGALGGAVKVGDVITGSYTYESTTPDTNPLATVGDYRHTTIPNGIILNVGALQFKTDPNNVDFLVEILNNHTGKDAYSLQSYNNIFPMGPAPAGNGYMINWLLEDYTQTALSSKALPATPPVLANWQSLSGLTIEVVPVPTPVPTLIPTYHFFRIRSHVTSANLCGRAAPGGTVTSQLKPLTLVRPNTGSITPINMKQFSVSSDVWGNDAFNFFCNDNKCNNNGKAPTNLKSSQASREQDPPNETIGKAGCQITSIASILRAYEKSIAAPNSPSISTPSFSTNNVFFQIPLNTIPQNNQTNYYFDVAGNTTDPATNKSYLNPVPFYVSDITPRTVNQYLSMYTTNTAYQQPFLGPLQTRPPFMGYNANATCLGVKTTDGCAGYDSGGRVKPEAFLAYTSNKYGLREITASSYPTWKEEIDHLLELGYPVMLRSPIIEIDQNVKNTTYGTCVPKIGEHWIVVYGSKDKYSVMDPGAGGAKITFVNGNEFIYEKTAGTDCVGKTGTENIASIAINAPVRVIEQDPQLPLGVLRLNSPVEMSLTDLQGRTTGYDAILQAVRREIPDANYYHDLPIVDIETGVPLGHETKVLSASGFNPGNYSLTLTGTGVGPFSLEAVTVGVDGKTSQNGLAGLATATSKYAVPVSFDGTQIAVPNFAPGDFNLDGNVDYKDLDLLMQNQSISLVGPGDPRDIHHNGIMVDGTKIPATTSTITGKPGLNKWYISNVTAALSATEANGIGVKYTTYAVDSGQWQTYATPIMISTEGIHNLRYYSADFFGVQESVNTIEVKVDKAPPRVTAELVSAGEVEKKEGSFKVQFTCSDTVDQNAQPTAALNGISVLNNQVVELEIHKKTKSWYEKGILNIEAPSFSLVATCSDQAGNTGTAMASPKFK